MIKDAVRTTSKDIANVVVDIMSNIVKDIVPLYGKGEGAEKQLDRLATDRFDALVPFFEEKKIKYCVLAAEGERDGVPPSLLQKHSDNTAKYYISLDPLEGTTSAARGGSRCLLAFAGGFSNELYKPLPDQLSCFTLASNEVPIETRDVESLKSVKSFFLRNKSFMQFSSLRRRETEGLLEKLGLSNPTIVNGESSFYMPSALANEVYLAGDCSLPLFLETDGYIGRSGIAEARIESRLWKFWAGVIVSGKIMKNYPSGMMGYLGDRLKAASNGEASKARYFFTPQEMTDMHCCGWSDEEIISVLTPKSFSPDYTTIIIGSLSGTEDRVLKRHSKRNMLPIKISGNRKKYAIQFYCKNGYVDRNGMKVIIREDGNG